MAVTVSWVAVVGNLAEFGENNLFRFALDPLLVAVVAAAIAAFIRGVWLGRIHDGPPATVVVDGPRTAAD